MDKLTNDYNRLSSDARGFLFKDHPMVMAGRLVMDGGAGSLPVIDATNGKEVGRVPPPTKRMSTWRCAPRARRLMRGNGPECLPASVSGHC